MDRADLVARLDAIAEDLGDLAYDQLAQVSSAAGRGAVADPALLAEERRLTRARRAVEKAAGLLRVEPVGLDGD